eukprot:6182424-Pleurochrysis_carterae.AAC.1
MPSPLTLTSSWPCSVVPVTGQYSFHRIFRCFRGMSTSQSRKSLGWGSVLRADAARLRFGRLAAELLRGTGVVAATAGSLLPAALAGCVGLEEAVGAGKVAASAALGERGVVAELRMVEKVEGELEVVAGKVAGAGIVAGGMLVGGTVTGGMVGPAPAAWSLSVAVGAGGGRGLGCNLRRRSRARRARSMAHQAGRHAWKRAQLVGRLSSVSSSLAGPRVGKATFTGSWHSRRRAALRVRRASIAHSWCDYSFRDASACHHQCTNGGLKRPHLQRSYLRHDALNHIELILMI